MAEQSKLKPSPESDVSDGPSELFEPVEFFRNLHAFWKTRNAILRKVPLYDYSKRQLDQNGWMGPWKFNVTQSTIAALPGTAYVALRALLATADEPTTVADKIIELSAPLLIPFVLMFTAYTVGSLFRNADLTQVKRKGASRMFLYLDGAYGFYSQILLSALSTAALVLQSLLSG